MGAVTHKKTDAEIAAELETKILKAGAKALHTALDGPDGTNPKILSIWNDRNLEKLNAALAENAVLKAQVGDNTLLDAAIAAKNTAEAELEKIKAEWSATVGAEVRKVKDELETERRKLTQRDITLKRAETALKDSADVSKIKQAFEFLGGLVSRMESWRPPSFFSPEVPNVWFIKRIWFPACEAWVAWENELLRMPKEQQIGAIAYESHAQGCMICQHRSKYDLSPERRQFLSERAKYMGIENEVFTINREKTDVCRLQPHPMPASIDYDYGARRNMQLKTLVEGLPDYL